MTATALALALSAGPALPPADAHLAPAVEAAGRALRERHGEAERPRIERGLAQAAAFWRAADGEPDAFRAFCESSFAPAAGADAVLGRFEEALEQVDGASIEVGRALRRHAELDLGPVLEVDRLFASLDLSAHVEEDLFAGRLAFAALLNFPLHALRERLAEGAGWTPRQWAADRLTARFGRRIPAEVNQAIARATAEADLYVAEYNLFAHHLVEGSAAAPARLFPKGTRLLSHWNLRDQIKSDYAAPDGLRRQRAIQRAMERIVDQTIPAAAVNDPTVDWNPYSGEVWPAPADAIEGGARPREKVDPAREADTRYARLLGTFRAARLADPHSPTAPTLVARRFEIDWEMPEERVVALLEEVLGSPLVPRAARLVERRLGRPLEPFDVWYAGFKPRSPFSEEKLTAMTRKRYPTAAAFQKDLPRILRVLGFSPGRARFLAERIAVDPARGAGHAQEAGRRGDKPRLRTRVGAEGMDYKGFEIALHELGHNTEQVFSLYEVSSTLLQGVPGNAFTEAMAFVFQARNLSVLGLPPPAPAEKRLLALNDLWATWEIAGVALVDLGVWKWMYAHPEATPAELREATLRAARDVWNRWYAPVLGARDSALLAIYSHTIRYLFYLPNYALGRLIAAQIEEHLARSRALGDEFERMTRQGRLTPDLWMERATGAPVSAAALLRAAEAALAAEERKAARRGRSLRTRPDIPGRGEAREAVAEAGTRGASSAGVPGRYVEQRSDEPARRRQCIARRSRSGISGRVLTSPARSGRAPVPRARRRSGAPPRRSR